MLSAETRALVRMPGIFCGHQTHRSLRPASPAFGFSCRSPGGGTGHGNVPSAQKRAQFMSLLAA